MAEIDDRNDVAPLDLGESHVGEGPVIAAGPMKVLWSGGP